MSWPQGCSEQIYNIIILSVYNGTDNFLSILNRFSPIISVVLNNFHSEAFESLCSIFVEKYFLARDQKIIMCILMFFKNY